MQSGHNANGILLNARDGALARVKRRLAGLAQAPVHRRARGAPERAPGTYRYLMGFNHVLKLLVNLLVFLFGARREDERRLKLRALAAFVLLLAQCLLGPATRKGRTEGFTDEGRVAKG